MKNIVLSTVLLVSLSAVSVFAGGADDIMQSNSSKPSTQQSKVTTRGSKSVKLEI